MIPVTRLDGSVMVVNDEQIAWIETRPDTVISMTNGEKLLVRETVDTLVERARDFQRSVHVRVGFPIGRDAQRSAAAALLRPTPLDQPQSDDEEGM